MKILEIIFITGICSLLCVAVIGCLVSVVTDIKKIRNMKKPKNKTDYPYLPLGMVTEHFGWSYEYVDKEGWRYIIWYKSSFCSVTGGPSVPVKYENLKPKSRVEADSMCRRLENDYFGQEEYYRKTQFYNKERTMKNNMTTHKVKNVELIKEDGNYYLDITYELENDSRVEELHIPRAKIPFCGDAFPEIKSEDKFGDPFEYLGRHISVPVIEKVTLNTGSCNDLALKRDKDGYRYTIKTIKEKTQEMTLAEIEKKLGHKIKIISEDKKK